MLITIQMKWHVLAFSLGRTSNVTGRVRDDLGVGMSKDARMVLSRQASPSLHLPTWPSLHQGGVCAHSHHKTSLFNLQMFISSCGGSPQAGGTGLYIAMTWRRRAETNTSQLVQTSLRTSMNCAHYKHNQLTVTTVTKRSPSNMQFRESGIPINLFGAGHAGHPAVTTFNSNKR